MPLPNCWEFKKCDNFADTSKCNAKTYTKANGYLGGINGGTSCMFIPNTNCSKDEFITIPAKIIKYCEKCEYYKFLQEKTGYISYVDFLLYILDNEKKAERKNQINVENK